MQFDSGSGNNDCQLRFAAEASTRFPVDLHSIARRMGEVTVSMAERLVESPTTNAVAP